MAKKTQEKKYCISVCGGTGCHAYNCEKVSEAFVTEIKRKKAESKIVMQRRLLMGS
jgi:NADH:ubiquinone oxidoreductase subunit E